MPGKSLEAAARYPRPAVVVDRRSQTVHLARQAIADEGNQVLVSAASAWEIASKFRLGKLPHAAQALDRFNELVTADGFEHLPIGYLHSLKAGAYSNEHRDPFDRMLAAQADLEKTVLVTLDPVFSGFQCKVLW